MELFSTKKEECLEPPKELASLQKWFASIITTPLGKNDGIQTKVAGRSVIEDARLYINPTQTLHPHERIQIYNQQYWWRLLKHLQTAFPIAVCILGRNQFNKKIGVPFLVKDPPSHWSIHALGKNLPEWMAAYYRGAERSLLYDAMCLDWAFLAGNICERQQSLDLVQLSQQSPEHLLAYTFHLQPHIFLFTWKSDLFAFRSALLLQHVDYWLQNPLPKLTKDKEHYFILYRNMNNQMAWRAITRGEYLLLEKFQKGASITTACEYIETLEKELYEQIAEKLQEWLQIWAKAGWII